MENKFFPLFIDITGKNILVIGAGNIAYRKVQTLLNYGAKITVITKEIKEEKFKLLKNITLKIGEFKLEYLEGVFMVVAGTDDKDFNNYIYKICDEKNILVNNITSKNSMNCRFVSILETDEYQIGISAKGNPKKSKLLKEELKNILF